MLEGAYKVVTGRREGVLGGAPVVEREAEQAETLRGGAPRRAPSATRERERGKSQGARRELTAHVDYPKTPREPPLTYTVAPVARQRLARRLRCVADVQQQNAPPCAYRITIGDGAAASAAAAAAASAASASEADSAAAAAAVTATVVAEAVISAAAASAAAGLAAEAGLACGGCGRCFGRRFGGLRV